MHVKCVFVSISTALICLFLGLSIVFAAPGDCDDNGMTNISDAVAAINYLSGVTGLPPNPVDCDCDFHQGITMGDVNQITAFAFLGGNLYPSFGDDLIQPSGVEFYYNEKINFTGGFAIDTIAVYMRAPAGFPIEGMILPFSFAAEAGQVEVFCEGVTVSGGLLDGLSVGYSIDNVSDIVLVMHGTKISIPAGASGLLFKAAFSEITPGTPNSFKFGSWEQFTPVIYKRYAYDGNLNDRAFYPAAIRAMYGDCNCDGMVNISDAVVIVNYIFLGGDPPGQCEYR